MIDDELVFGASCAGARPESACGAGRRAEPRRVLPGARDRQPVLRGRPVHRRGGDGSVCRADRPPLPVVRLLRRRRRRARHRAHGVWRRDGARDDRLPEQPRGEARGRAGAPLPAVLGEPSARGGSRFRRGHRRARSHEGARGLGRAALSGRRHGICRGEGRRPPRRHAAHRRRPLWARVEGVHAGDGQGGVRESRVRLPEEPLHGRHQRRRVADRASTTTRASSPRRPTLSAASSMVLAPTARWERTRTRSRSSARRRRVTRRASSSTTRRSPGRARRRTCASDRSRSARPISSSAPSSSPATSFSSSIASRCSTRRSTARCFCSTARSPPTSSGTSCRARCRRRFSRKHIRLYTIDADRVATEAGMPGRINTIMQTCFFAISGVLPRDEAIARIKDAIQATYARKGKDLVESNFAAVDRALENLHEVPLPASATSTRVPAPIVPARAPDFVRQVTAMMIAGRGDELPVSALPVDGTYPSGTAQWEKRNISDIVPVWKPELCIQCGNCAMVCPHATIRARYYDDPLLAAAPDGVPVGAARRPRIPEPALHAAGGGGGLHRVRALCRGLSRAQSGSGRRPGHQHGSQGARFSSANAGTSSSSTRFPTTSPWVLTRRSCAARSTSRRSSSSPAPARAAARRRT